MAQPVVLPAGYTARPLDPARDLPDVLDLLTGCERALHGERATEADSGEIAAVLARPGFDPAADTLLVHGPDGRLAAWAWTDRRCECRVHPAHRGRRIGTALLGWMETRAAEQGVDKLVQVVADLDAAGLAMLRTYGYRPKGASWLLEIPLDALPDLPPAPAGIRVRPFRPGDPDDAHAAHRVVEDAFADWKARRMSFEEWVQHAVGRETFTPARSPLAVTGADDRVVGVALSLDQPGSPDGYVESLAVDRDHRRRGIARHLLHHAFLACREAGLSRCTLWTHSGTGALDLYLKVGMTVRYTSVVLEKTLPA
ncbi:GNAT family N-acetyltransferase [Kitasatospora cineracea]|uniref:Ribosomal protein S18 acetylase RimI-like enzyme n=1 Tax=Kitasatospora cineracea TaxID=88074 RepID=A0A3N4S112_9ACTN|nr:GNAT family N-acetyltransferase [Kitasatospora cineracea]ROR46747.1 ribosomal protein S18 acetylase RimI-like enzyme [Kitasatospora cineracea]RPE36919.1 ribosomal protein S18 acetylase RimI-like enzyme [Kitasatospora cineracea]